MPHIVRKADFLGENIHFSNTGCTFLFNDQYDSVKIESRLIGKFVPNNIILACACARTLGIAHNIIKEGVYACNAIRGRMEKVYKDIIIDYAHTPEAMKGAIISLKEIYKNKRLTIVFGCGGDRDKGKRKVMGEIASEYCDKVIITSDNSRGEEAINIIREIESGIKNTNYFIIEDREKAINYAIENKLENEIILLLGKGHESYEINKQGIRYFNEKEIIEEAIKNVQNKSNYS